LAIFFVLLGGLLGAFLYLSEKDPDSFASRFPFVFGLDIRGGSHLVYHADVSAVPSADASDFMSALRDVIERRVNVFGVSEPVVQVEEKYSFSSTEADYRLTVELPGVTDLNQAIAMIGATPTLEFKTEKSEEETTEILEPIGGIEKLQSGDFDPSLITEDPFYNSTLLTGRYLKRATIVFGQTGAGSAGLSPSVSLEFDSEGAKIFEEMTKANLGKTIAIYLDGGAISTPVVRDPITDGKAIISGDFTPEEARELAGRLNSGALPVPITLLSTQTIGASLGERSIDKSMTAGLYGFAIVALFLMLWYRLPGVLASLALLFYLVLTLTIFKLIPVTLTSAGLAGLILSIGMAVDANILIFERIKEELLGGLKIDDAINSGVARAWTSIRDSNFSSIITAIVLFWFGTSLIKGFALTFGLGVMVSMFSAITVTKTFLLAVGSGENKGFKKFLFGVGFPFLFKKSSEVASPELIQNQESSLNS